MIRLAKSTLTPADKDAVRSVLDREFLGMGPEVRRFEEALAAFFERPVVAVSNGTAALQLALQACGIGPDDEVLVPSLTYVASFQAISATGARPVACDVDSTLHLDPEDAAARISGKTRAIMPVHYGGSVGALDGIYAIAAQHGLRVIEDAAHAFGSVSHGQRVGSTGDVACFSFDGIKNITSGEGGCIVTTDTACLEQASDLRLLGVQKDSEMRYSGARSWEFDVIAQGWRYHMSDIMAALGLSQLHRFDEISARRKELAVQYDGILEHLDCISVVKQDRRQVVPHLYTILLPQDADRNDFRQFMESKGIQTGIHYFPNHKLSFYRNDESAPLPVTDSLFPRILSIPFHLDLVEDDLVAVASAIHEYFE